MVTRRYFADTVDDSVPKFCIHKERLTRRRCWWEMVWAAVEKEVKVATVVEAVAKGVVDVYQFRWYHLGTRKDQATKNLDVLLVD